MSAEQLDYLVCTSLAAGPSAVWLTAKLTAHDTVQAITSTGTLCHGYAVKAFARNEDLNPSLAHGLLDRQECIISFYTKICNTVQGQGHEHLMRPALYTAASQGTDVSPA